MTSAATQPWRRRRWWILGAAVLLVLVLPLGCSMLGPGFEPAIDRPKRVAGLLLSAPSIDSRSTPGRVGA